MILIVIYFQKLIDEKNDKINFDIIPKANEEYNSVTYGCIRFIDSYGFISDSLDKLVNTLDVDEFINLKKKLQMFGKL